MGSLYGPGYFINQVPEARESCQVDVYYKKLLAAGSWYVHMSSTSPGTVVASPWAQPYLDTSSVCTG